MSMKSDYGTEYEFTLADGSKRYDFVFERREVYAFMRLHGAVKANPVERD